MKITNLKDVPEDIRKRARWKINEGLGFLLSQNRFYYYLISNIKVKESLKAPTIGVGFLETGSKQIFLVYNPLFIADCHFKNKAGELVKYDLKDQEISDILIHELLHICLRHLFNVDIYSDKDALNWAQDIVVNDMVFRNRHHYQNPNESTGDRPPLSKMVMTKHNFESTKNLNISEHTFGDLYSLIMKEMQDNPSKREKMKGKATAGEMFQDEHGQFNPGEHGSQDEVEGALADAKPEEVEAMVKNLLNKALKEDFDRGSLPGELLKELNALEPKADFRSTLDHFVKNCKQDTSISTWKKPSRRYGNLARGHTADFKPKILLGVDSSGSVFCHEDALTKIGEYFNFALNHVEKLQLVYCDTEVRLDKEFVLGDTLPHIVGGGGTVLSPIFERAQEEDYDGVILITDGYCDELNTHGLPHVCLIVPGGAQAPGIEKENCLFFDDFK